MRNRIILAAIEEINQNGAKFTMLDIARRAASSKRTLYEHFESKEALVGAIVDLIVKKVTQADEAILADTKLSIIEKLKAILTNNSNTVGYISNRFILDLKHYFPDKWQQCEAVRDHKWQCVEKLLLQGRESSYLSPVDIAIIKIIFFATLNELMNQEFLMHNNITLLDAAEKMADILYFGIGRRN